MLLTDNKDWAGRFASCVTGWLLLKTRLAAVKRAVVAQKVLLLSRQLETWLALNNTFRSGFKCKTMNTTILKSGSFERENFRARNSTIQPHERTQSAPNQ